MRRELMDIICCPQCKSDLELKIEEEKDEEIISGTLRCKKCKIDFPIEDSIPNLLLPENKT